MFYKVNLTNTDTDNSFKMEMSYQEWVAIKKFIGNINECAKTSKQGYSIPVISLEEISYNG